LSAEELRIEFEAYEGSCVSIGTVLADHEEDEEEDDDEDEVNSGAGAFSSG
jgi:hypothetical protein